jgi:hypothetical protein
MKCCGSSSEPVDLLAQPVSGQEVQGGVLFRVLAAFMPPGIQQQPA